VILKLAVGISRFLADFKPEALANNISWLCLIKLALGVLLCVYYFPELICTFPFVLLKVMPFWLPVLAMLEVPVLLLLIKRLIIFFLTEFLG